MKTLRIRPAAGRVVRDPDLHDLISAPRVVPDTPFWRRRLRDGDVSPDPDPASAPERATPAAGVSATAAKSVTRRTTGTPDGGTS
ncbi:DUF2635 domain-containing protein [Paraburkholderia adhaesiva]|uniref:DUF2635 domain-containing protein n=1 Tax=Paraburkholderia adhaesiva TaxID=2883244 RepID=UPI001F445B9F|nr:DUF2635 domain-containing protein [Paraburkholderia adhaesiva]